MSSKQTKAKDEEIQKLIRDLNDFYWGTQEQAAIALAKMGPEAAPAIPALIEAMRYENVSWAAEEALQKIGKAAIPALTEALKNKSENIRKGAAYVLNSLKKL